MSNPNPTMEKPLGHDALFQHMWASAIMVICTFSLFFLPNNKYEVETLTSAIYIYVILLILSMAGMGISLGVRKLLAKGKPLDHDYLVDLGLALLFNIMSVIFCSGLAGLIIRHQGKLWF